MPRTEADYRRKASVSGFFKLSAVIWYCSWSVLPVVQSDLKSLSVVMFVDQTGLESGKKSQSVPSKACEGAGRARDCRPWAESEQ